MACNTSFELHHNFPKLAEEAGFAFNTHRPKVRMDWNKLRLLDVDCLIREKRFVLIEQHVHDILDCVLDSEFDVRILDEGVVKMFRLAQLTVEYQQFCRHYLDRSVFVLRDELNAVTKELEAIKQNDKRKDEEAKKMKRRYKSHPKTPNFLYGNDNIANAILKTLTANRPDIFPSSTLADTALQYNKCKYCEKVFMNQLYLKSHLDRRHPGMQDLPVKDTTVEPTVVNNNEANHQLQAEVKDLQQKLKEMEDNMAQQIAIVQAKTISESHNSVEKLEPKTIKYKDVEVSVNNDNNLIEKLEEWKTKEQSKHSEELNGLCRQIMESIHSLKEQTTNIGTENSNEIVNKLYQTITEQGKQILELKQELSKNNTNKVVMKNHENDAMREELKICTQKIDAQTKQCEILLANLNKVALQAQEARALAESERQKAANLQAQLEEHLIKARSPADNTKKPDTNKMIDSQENKNLDKRRDSKTIDNKKSLEELHRTAQELLNIASSSSNSSLDKIPEKPTVIRLKERNEADYNKNSKKDIKRCVPVETSKKYKKSLKDSVEKRETIIMGKEKSKSYSSLIPQRESSPIISKSSPTRIIRAKICEEVHKQLVDTGIDPLTNSIKQPAFEKVLNKLQNDQKLKSKNNSAYQRIKHSLLTYLDAQVTNSKEPNISSRPVPKNKASSKPEKLKSMLSNIKSRALEFVKENKHNHNEYDRDIAEREITLKVPQTRQLVKELLSKNQAMCRRDFNENNDDSFSEESGSATSSDEDKSVSPKKPSYSVEKLIKSPVRRPSTANGIHETKKTVININKAHSSTNLLDVNAKTISNESLSKFSTCFSDNILVTTDEISHKNTSEGNIQTGPKGVLKNAPSTSSLNKKKVLFDMDAIQMKSLSASPSQSITEKSDSNENFELGLVNLDDEEWDISSIDNGLPKVETTKIDIKTSKVMELKQVIEGQLEKRSKTPMNVPVGAVDVLKASMAKGPSGGIGGSNTSLGSSVFDESDTKPVPTRQTLMKGKSFNRENDDSELDISEFSLDDGNKKDSF